MSVLSYPSLLPQPDYQLTGLLLLLFLEVALVQSLRSLLLNCHDLIVSDHFQSHLSALCLPPIVFDELVEVLVLIKTVLDAVAVGPTSVNFIIWRDRGHG